MIQISVRDATQVYFLQICTTPEGLLTQFKVEVFFRNSNEMQRRLPQYRP